MTQVKDPRSGKMVRPEVLRVRNYVEVFASRVIARRAIASVAVDGEVTTLYASDVSALLAHIESLEYEVARDRGLHIYESYQGPTFAAWHHRQYGDVQLTS